MTTIRKIINMREIYIILILLIILPVIAYGQNNSSIYRVHIDNYHGFYRVYNMTLGEQINYHNDTLNINKGDTVMWSNEASDRRLTVISVQKLWSEKYGYLPWPNRRFSYTFNKPGTYNVYIKEYPKFTQRIVVGPLEPNLSINKTNLSTDKTNLSIKANITKTNSTNLINSIINTNTTKSNFTNSTPVVKINSTEFATTSIMRPGFEVLTFILVMSSVIYFFNKKMR